MKKMSDLRRMEGNVLFNDALDTIYLWLYGVRHMVKDHSDSERGNPLPPHGLLFPNSSSMGQPRRINPTTHRTMSECSYHGASSRSSDLRTHTTHFIYGYMMSDIWQRATPIATLTD